MFTLTRQTNSSYRCNDPVALVDWLSEQDYHAEDVRSSHELIRMRKTNSLIVVYNSGSVLLQGSDTETPRQLFADRPASGPLFEQAAF
jgi:ribonuclease HIII